MGCVVCATRRIRCSFARRATAPPMRTGLFPWLLSCWFFILFFCLLGVLFHGRFAGLLLPGLLFAGCLPRRLARYRPRVRGLFHWRIRIRVWLHAGERIQKSGIPEQRNAFAHRVHSLAPQVSGLIAHYYRYPAVQMLAIHQPRLSQRGDDGIGTIPDLISNQDRPGTYFPGLAKVSSASADSTRMWLRCKPQRSARRSSGW